MQPKVVSRTTTGTKVVPLNFYGRPEVSVQVVISGGTATYSIQQTLDDPSGSSPTWFDHSDSTLVAATTNKQGNYAYIPRAVRLNVTAISGATVTMTVIQAG
jgi:hypothetical protein